MNLNSKRFVRVRRWYIAVQVSLIGILVASLGLWSSRLSSLLPDQESFRKEFSDHRVDLDRGRGDSLDHRNFLDKGSFAQISFEKTFLFCLLTLSSLVLVWIAMGLHLHKLYALALEAMPEQAGSLRLLAAMERLWAFVMLAVAAGGGGYAWFTIQAWEGKVGPPSILDLPAAYAWVGSVLSGLKTDWVVWETTMALAFFFSLVGQIEGVRQALKADSAARLKRFERDVIS